MNEDIATKQTEYLTSLFGFGKSSDGSHPVMNSDAKQEDAYAQNMSQLSSFCCSEDYSDVDILSFFATSGTPVGKRIVFEHLGSVAIWLFVSWFWILLHIENERDGSQLYVSFVGFG